jgi:hypothetical protein
MGYYRQDFGNHVRHAFVVVGILLLHLLAIRALWSGLTNPRVRYLPTIFQIDVLPVEKLKVPPPRLSPVSLTESQAIQVVTPQVDIPVFEDLPPPFQVIPVLEERAASSGPPAAPAVRPVPNVKARPIYVRADGTDIQRNRFLPANPVSRPSQFASPRPEQLTACR